MRLILVYVLFFIGSCLSLFNPVWAACFYSWNNIFRPGDFSQATLPFSAANFVTISYSLSLLLHAIRGRYRFRPNLGTYFIVLFMAWTAIASAFTPAPSIAMEGLIVVSKYLIPLIFISMGFETLKDIDFFCWTMALSVGVWGAQAGLHGIMKGGAVIDMGIPGAQMTDRNDFIVGLLIALPLLVYMIRYYNGWGIKGVRSLLVLITLLSFIAVPISLSRGGMLGLSIMILMITLLSRKKIRNLFLLLVTVPIVYFSLPDFVFERMSTIQVGGEQTEGSAKARIGNMHAGIAMAADYPIFGVGPMAFLKYVPNYAEEWLEPHSIWIKAAAEIGIVGLVIYITVVFTMLWKLVQIYKNQFDVNRKISHMAIAFVSAFLGFNIAATFSNKLYSEYQWTLIATAGAFTKIANASLKKSRLKQKDARKRIARVDQSDPNLSEKSPNHE